MKTKLIVSIKVVTLMAILMGCTDDLPRARKIAPGGGPSQKNYAQIERLAKPGINELFVTTDASYAAFNSISPKFDLRSDIAAVAKVQGEATTTLGAIHDYALLLKAKVPGFGTLNPPSVNAVVAGFLPDSMRIDTSAASGYGTLCGGASGPTLCGGRMIEDDVIEISYSYLIAGALSGTDDGIKYRPTSGNAATGHKPTRDSFPYLAQPY